MKKRFLAALLILAMVFSMCPVVAMAAPGFTPPPLPTEESEDYDGPIINYPDKELWFDSTIYGGFMNPYLIMKQNGDDTFDIDAFINSKMGELTMSRVKYELALIGNGQYAGEFMVNYWKDQGVIETAYDSDDKTHEWITYVPEYMYDAENAGKVYPVVVGLHGNNNDLFTSMNLGFVHICYEEGFIVLTPEAENSDSNYVIDNLESYLDKMEELGYPIDRTRVYVGGMSKGGGSSISTGLALSDTVAAIAPHSSAFGLTSNIPDDFIGMPMWLQLGESDMRQLPLNEGVINGLNAWLEANDCQTKATATDANAIGITADKVYTQEIDGTTYTFAEFYNTEGNKTAVIVGIAGLPHWVSYSYPKLAWDFMKQYSIVNGERVFNKEISVTEAVANCHIGAFGQAVDEITVTLNDISVLESITADGFTIENASKFVGMIPCNPYVEKVEVEDGKLVLTMGGDEFLLYKSNGSEKQGQPLKITYSKDDVLFTFGYADITADNGAIDAMVEKEYEGMQYFSYEPESDEELPLVVYLHGNALAGLQKIALAAVDALVQPEFQAEHPCYVLAPTSMNNLNGTGMGWNDAEQATVIELVQQYIASGKIDTNRIYITGNSLGAVGTVNTVLNYPDLFAAAMPMCGTVFGIADDAAIAEQFKAKATAIVDLPMLIVQAKSDPVAHSKHSELVYDILKEMGAPVEAVFYEDSQLIESGVIEYTHAADAMAKYDPALYEWLFAQEKQGVTTGLVQRGDGFYEYYDENGNQAKLDYVKLGEELYFFNSKGVGAEIDYTWISDHVIQIFDNTNDSCFIVIGDEGAAVIDGMNGTVDLMKIAKFFTDKPLVAILTHGHGDHTGGVQSFDKVYLNAADFELYKSMIAGSFRFRMIDYGNYLRDTGLTLDYTLLNLAEDIMEENPDLELVAIEDGETFDLGDITVECIAAPGHTPGSMAMLIREDRVLVTGDAANRFTQVQGVTVENYLKTLQKLKAREADYDEIYSSHGALLPDGTNTAHMAPNMIDELIEGCEAVLKGASVGYTPDGDPYVPFIPVRWGFMVNETDRRADGGCGNFMFNINNVWNTPAIQVEDVVAYCHIGAFGQAVDKIVVTLPEGVDLSAIKAEDFTIAFASKFVGMIPCAPYVEKVEVEDGKLVLTMGGDEFLLYKSDGSEKGWALKVTYSKDDVHFTFGYTDITADNGAIDAMVEKEYEGMQYFSYEPESNEKLPLVIYMHGNALAGLQKIALAAVDALVQPEFQAEHPCYVLAPTSMLNLNGQGGWDEAERALVIELLQTYIDSGKIDTNRIYITGNSMGGFGTWNMILDNPDLFAAAMPMCGTAPYATVEAKLQGIMDAEVAIKIVHSLDDRPQTAQDTYQKLLDAGYPNITARFYTMEEITPFGIDEYPHATDAMAKYDPALYEWMFAQQKGTATPPPPVIIVPTHSCTSKCDVCGGCKDDACTYGVCAVKCECVELVFEDVAPNSKYAEAIAYVYEKGLMEGTSATTFSPETALTRGMVVTILHRMEGTPHVLKDNVFTDVADGMYYTEAVKWAAANGIVNGFGNDTFEPNTTITWEQMATILYRYAYYKGYDRTASADLSAVNGADAIGAWAADAMSWAYAEGVVTGDLTPKTAVERAQFALCLMTFCENVK